MNTGNGIYLSLTWFASPLPQSIPISKVILIADCSLMYVNRLWVRGGGWGSKVNPLTALDIGCENVIQRCRLDNTEVEFMNNFVKVSGHLESSHT